MVTHSLRKGLNLEQPQLALSVPLWSSDLEARIDFSESPSTRRQETETVRMVRDIEPDINHTASRRASAHG